MGKHETVSIYALRDPFNNEVYYVGKAVAPRSRLQGHVTAANVPKYPVSLRTAEILAQGRRPIMKILEVAPYEQWEERERFWIAKMRTEGIPILNLASGGQSIDTEFSVRGAEHYRTHFTEADILAIRSERAGGASQQSLAEKFGVERECISAICKGRSWSHVAGEVSTGPLATLKGELNHKAVLTAVQVTQMRVERSQGSTLNELAARYGINNSSVAAACTGRTWYQANGPITREFSSRRGYLPPTPKINAEQAQEIKRLLREARLPQKEIARLFNVSTQLISAINTGKVWT